MSLLATLQLALSRIGAAKTRSALTMLGVIIGVASLVGLTSIAQGATSGINDRLSSLGANQITVMSGQDGNLTQDDAEALAELPVVNALNSQVQGNASAVLGDVTAELQLTGVSPSYAGMHELDIAVGAFLSDAPDAQAVREIVLGSQAAEDLSMTSEDVGSTLRIDGKLFRIAGVLDDSSGFNRGATGYITLDVARTLFAPGSTLNSIEVQAASAEEVDFMESMVSSTLLQLHKIDNEADADFSIMNQASLQESIASVTATLSLLLGGIASISLVVGGIGIMNIMLVSVRERTREIGVRRAIGALRRHILAQFLIESIVLSLMGGLIGLALGEAVAYVLAGQGGWEFAVELTTVGYALAFSMLVGVVFGVWPAYQASRLQPVEALRFE